MLKKIHSRRSIFVGDHFNGISFDKLDQYEQLVLLYYLKN